MTGEGSGGSDEGGRGQEGAMTLHCKGVHTHTGLAVRRSTCSS